MINAAPLPWKGNIMSIPTYLARIFKTCRKPVLLYVVRTQGMTNHTFSIDSYWGGGMRYHLTAYLTNPISTLTFDLSPSINRVCSHKIAVISSTKKVGRGTVGQMDPWGCFLNSETREVKSGKWKVKFYFPDPWFFRFFRFLNSNQGSKIRWPTKHQYDVF